MKSWSINGIMVKAAKEVDLSEAELQIIKDLLSGQLYNQPSEQSDRAESTAGNAPANRRYSQDELLEHGQDVSIVVALNALAGTTYFKNALSLLEGGFTDVVTLKNLLLRYVLDEDILSWAEKVPMQLATRDGIHSFGLQ
jgi:hypothetical protein